VGFAAFFAVDAYLFAFGGFLRSFGQATQEGQVLSKVDRARTLAPVADVIFFGSSYVRSGIAGQAFLDVGVLPLNFAVSGGGPLYDYFALKRIAPILEARTDKPLLVLEIKTDPLMQTRNSAWSEYPQYSAIVRRRFEMLGAAPMLWRNFRDFGMTSQFYSSVLVPSSIYRAQAVPMLGAGTSLDGYFYGAEDFSGFSPLFTTAVPSMVPRGPAMPPLPLEELWPGKIEFLRAFLALAKQTGCPVLLYASPTIMLGRDGQMLDRLIDLLQSELPDARVLRTSDLVLEVGDFDEGGHLNIKGADAAARKLIAALSLSGDHDALERKLDQAFERRPIPAADRWLPANARATGAGASLTILPVATLDGLIASSPVITLDSPGEWLFELAFPSLSGRLAITVEWTDTSGRKHTQQSVTPVDAAHFAGSNRMFLRMADAVQFSVTITDYSVLTQQPPSAGRVEFLRLWKNRS